MRIQHKILEEIPEEHKHKIKNLEAAVAHKELVINQLQSTIDKQAEDKTALDEKLEDLCSIISRKEMEHGGSQEAALRLQDQVWDLQHSVLQLIHSQIQLNKQIEKFDITEANLSSKLTELNEAYTQLTEESASKENKNIGECYKLDKELKSVLNSNRSLSDAKRKLEVSSRWYSCHLTDRYNIG